MDEIDVADLKKLVMLQVNELIRISLFPLVQVVHDLLFQPEGRKQLALLIGFQLQRQPERNCYFHVGPEGADSSLSYGCDYGDEV